jgi:hypothetical protein
MSAALGARFARNNESSDDHVRLNFESVAQSEKTHQRGLALATLEQGNERLI